MTLKEVALSKISKESVHNQMLCLIYKKKLLKDIDGSLIYIQDADVYTLIIEKSLLSRRTLLVLDGIDKVEQLDVLSGEKGIHQGSKIIITSKNRYVTEKCKLFEIQVPPKHVELLLGDLYKKELLQLLSWYAILFLLGAFILGLDRFWVLIKCWAVLRTFKLI